MPSVCLAGVSRRRGRGCTRRNPKATPSDDLVERNFAVDAPDRLWVADITQHRTGEGWLYGTFVIDAYSRRVLGWALGDHCRTDLVVDALQMALWRRHGADGCVHHSDHGCQYTSWAFGHRLRQASLLSSIGSIGDAFDCEDPPGVNALAESFFATLQTDLLDRQTWSTRNELAQAIFEYVEAFYNPPALVPRDAGSQRLRTPPQRHECHRCGMIPVATPSPSGKPGELHHDRRHHPPRPPLPRPLPGRGLSKPKPVSRDAQMLAGKVLTPAQGTAFCAGCSWTTSVAERQL